MILGTGIFLVFVPVFGWFAGSFPLIFVLIGAGLCAIPAIAIIREKRIWKKGEPFVAKICGYVEDTSITVNGAYPINVRVRFFDNAGQIKETILNTNFARGNVSYPIGATIDIRGYNGKYSFDADSVRDEVLPHEENLMDNRPLDTADVKYIAVTCPNCGASFKAVKGYTDTCTDCESYITTE